MTHLAGRSLWTLRTLLNRLGPTAAFFVGLMTVAAVVFYLTTDTTLLNSFYWSIVTGFTVGFGDVLPVAAPSIVLTMVYIPLVSITYLVFAAHIVGVVLDSRSDFTKEDEARMFANQLEMRAELQALVDHLDIANKVDYSEEGCN